MTARTDSFPFFNIAQDTGLPYRLILQCVDYLEGDGYPPELVPGLTHATANRIADAWQAEKRRRDVPQ